MVAKIRHPTPVLKNLHTLFAWKILYPVGFLRLITTLSSPCSFDHTTYKIPNPYSSFLLLLGHLHDWMMSLERAPLYYKLPSSSSPSSIVTLLHTIIRESSLLPVHNLTGASLAYFHPSTVSTSYTIQPEHQRQSFINYPSSSSPTAILLLPYPWE